MSRVRAKKPKGRLPSEIAESSNIQGIKREGFQLHDEADLVNFRSDSFSRFMSNQDYLDNVASKLFHTSKIVPPSSFPLHAQKAYEENASEEDIMKVLSEMKPEDVYSGDLRLMQAKVKHADHQLSELHKELTDLKYESIIGEETRFQRDAVERLAKAQSLCSSAESTEEAEGILNSILTEYKQKFSREYVSEQSSYSQFSLPLSKLAPDIKMEIAPAQYNPRSIMTYIDIKNDSQREQVSRNDAAETNGSGVQTSLENGIDLDPSAFGESNQYMGGTDYEEFGILMDDNDGKLDNLSHGSHVNNRNEMPFNRQMNDERRYTPEDRTNKQEIDATGKLTQESHDRDENFMNKMDGDVDMDEIDQFLADPEEADVMDDVGALMNFDEKPNSDDIDFGQGNPNNKDIIDDDAFNVDFLSQMGNDMD